MKVQFQFSSEYTNVLQPRDIAWQSLKKRGYKAPRRKNTMHAYAVQKVLGNEGA